MKNPTDAPPLTNFLVKGEVPGYGEPHEFLRRCREEPGLRDEPRLDAIFNALVNNASVCSFCGVGCPYTKVTGKTGVEKLVPLSPLGLCVKGSSSLESGGRHQRKRRMDKRGLNDDRITSPMIRGHDGHLKPVSWERALDRAAWLFLHCREWVGPEAVAIYGNGQKTMEAIYMASLYKLAFKLPTVGANSEHCLSSAGGGHVLNFGNEASFTWREFEELDHADVIVLHGTNPVITFPQVYAKAKRNKKALKVVIDPVRSDTVDDLETSGAPNLHLRFAQGGDVLFNLAVARLIFENGWEDASYLARNVDDASLTDFRRLVAEDRCSPEAVAREIVLEEQDPAELVAAIHNYAALFAKPSPNGERPRVAIISSMGINQSTGSIGFATNLNLLLITGNVGRKGAGSLRVAGQSNATSELMLGFNSRHLLFNLDPRNPEHRAAFARVYDIPERNIMDDYGTPVAGMADNDLLYCFIFIGTQFTKNMPRLGHWMRRLGRSFNIVIDSFLAEGVAEYADVVFPAMTYTERTGVIQRGDRSFQLQQGLTTPPILAWSDEQILARLAMKIAERLENPHTARLNDLDADDIRRVFGRYVGNDGQVDPAGVFDHMAQVSQELDVYCKMVDEAGDLITHERLREQAGRGIQWQGDGRYANSQNNDEGFPTLVGKGRVQAKLVSPPDALLRRLVTWGNDHLRSLISGRGRPGLHRKRYIARYNSGVKTLPINGRDKDDYYVEVHPNYAATLGLAAGDPVRITSYHGTVVSRISLNKNVPEAFPFVDFVPGEVNRLTDYVDQDAFTNQSLIKRTPVRMEPLSATEAELWNRPHAVTLKAVTQTLYDRLRTVYPTEEDQTEFLRLNPNCPDWLPWESMRRPSTPEEQKLAIAVSAYAAFLQRYMSNEFYRADAAEVLKMLPKQDRHRFLYIMMPLLRKLDYATAVMPLLTDLTGRVPLRDAAGEIKFANLTEAHNSAVLELKEEVVAIQLYLAVKTGLEVLHGRSTVVDRDSIAIITGIAIPCAGDVPAYYMGINPADLSAERLLHGRIVGSNAIVVVDRHTNRGVRVDTHTGILPKNRELMRLRNRVIGKKRAASAAEHNRFFDVLEELMAYFVRTGLDNFNISPVFNIPWREYGEKLAFVPANPGQFREHLRRSGISPTLAQCMVDLGILKPEKDAALISELKEGCQVSNDQEQPQTAVSFSEVVTSETMTSHEKVAHVLEAFIEPILINDGGRIDLINFDEATGNVDVRFLGSCANCPCSILSLETVVIPPLMKIPGVTSVTHRSELQNKKVLM